MWSESFGKEIARLLNLMADKPNRRPHPTGEATGIFDGGQWTVMTGVTSYKFSDGSTAIYGTARERELTIRLATGEEVHIKVPTTQELPATVSDIMRIESLTIQEIFLTLLRGETTKKVEVLTELVLALLMEVEALRSALLEESQARGETLKNSSYGQAYRSTALLTHNAAGPSCGVEKLLERWVSSRRTRNSIPLRETLMLMRLGYSQEEIEKYAEEAESYEMRT
jgi:hypothetical protein